MTVNRFGAESASACCSVLKLQDGAVPKGWLNGGVQMRELESTCSCMSCISAGSSLIRLDTMMFRCLNVAVAKDPISLKARAVGSDSDRKDGGKRAGDNTADAVVTVLMLDGHVLELPRRLKCSELLVSYPNHAVCHARALVMRQKGQGLAADSYLEQGRLYFLLPKPGRRVRRKEDPKSSINYASDVGSQNGSAAKLKLVISKQYLARILAEAKSASSCAVKPPPLARKPTPPARKPHRARPQAAANCRHAKFRSQWSAPLDPIAEIASIESQKGLE